MDSGQVHLIIAVEILQQRRLSAPYIVGLVGEGQHMSRNRPEDDEMIGGRRYGLP